MAGESTAKNLSLTGAILSAGAAASCCLGPLVLGALGIGGAGAFARLAALRPYILGITVALLAVGFYLTYRRPRDCGCEHRVANRAGRVGLWIATVLVLLFAVAPALVARGLDQHATAAAPGVATETVAIRVEGADCEACAVHLKRALAKVGGFHDLVLDVLSQTITVTYEPEPGRLEAYVAAIDALGYEAVIKGKAAAR